MHSPLSRPALRSIAAPSISARGLAVWLLVGYVGLGLLLALPALAQAWRIDQAGIELNRRLQTQDSSAMDPVLAVLGTSDQDRGPSYWRTLGAAAVRAPSDEAFERLKAAQDRGELDRIGALWLGEVAAATGHWEEARAAYSRIDATNLLVERGDAALEAGKGEAAVRWYAVAAASLRAAREREEAGQWLRGNNARADARPSGEDPVTTNRAVPLLRIGRGFLSLGMPEEAIPVLSDAVGEMKTGPPGVREQQAIELSLAQALAQAALPEEGRSRIVDTAQARPPGTMPPAREAEIRALLASALERDRTGWAVFQAGRVLALIGDRDGAAEHLAAAIELDPMLTDAYLTLGAIYETTGLQGVARGIYEKGLEHISSDERLKTAWALASYASMPTAEALPRLEEVAESDVRDPYVFAALGDAYLESGRPDDARAAYRRGLARSPGAEPLLARLERLRDPLWRLE